MNAYGIIRTFGVIVLLAAASVQCSKIHERMTDDEIVKLFRTTRDNVPEYEVALVRHDNYTQPYQSLRMQFTAFGKEIDTYLHPSDGQLFGANTPVWLASTKSDGTVEYKKMREGIVGMVTSTFLMAPGNLSTVVVTQPKGEKPSFNGNVGGMVVRSLPKRFQEEARSRRNSEAPNASGNMLDSDYHVIIKSPLIVEKELRRFERQFREASQSADRTDAARVKRSHAEIIYPSVLVQTDYKVSMTTQNDPDHYEEILYQLAYWNAVDLRYRHVNDPKIRLRIVGIIIGQDRKAVPYLENYRSEGVVDVEQAFDKTREYWYNMTLREDFPEEAYNIVVTLTDTAMWYKGQDASGVAYPAYCLSAKASKQFSAIAITRDEGTFGGILTTAHELGHIFGLTHDEDFYDAECDGSNRFLMSLFGEPSPKKLQWSSCSLNQFSYFLRTNFINCYDRPADFYPPGDPGQRLLPGDVWGSHKQCQALGYDWACDPTPDMCTQLRCYFKFWNALWSGMWGCFLEIPAAEGTLCGSGRKCVDGVCQCMTTDCIYEN